MQKRRLNPRPHTSTQIDTLEPPPMIKKTGVRKSPRFRPNTSTQDDTQEPQPMVAHTLTQVDAQKPMVEENFELGKNVFDAFFSPRALFLGISAGILIFYYWITKLIFYF